MIAFNEDTHPKEKNVLGGPLEPCCFSPMTGFYRTGYCETGPDDAGRHTVCVTATDEFLQFSKSVGNDLSTPIPQYRFPGLKAGDRWCLCALRWKEAFENNSAPKVHLEATHRSVLEHIDLEALKEYAAE
ncbi:MAG: DUF2237 domain-containing protein [Verrucomicrobiota bacterium]